MKLTRVLFSAAIALAPFPAAAQPCPFDQQGVWEQLATSGPTPPRYTTAMCYDNVRDRVVLFGGEKPAPNPQLGDTWEWDGTVWMQKFPTHSPTPRRGHDMVFDTVNHVPLLFGGVDVTMGRGDTWEWNGNDWTQVGDYNPLNPVSPAPRAFHAMAYDTDRGRAVLYGGEAPSFPFGYATDVWEWDSATRQWIERMVPPEPAPAPGCLTYHAMAYDTCRHATVVYGGYCNGGFHAQTWEWNGGASTWALQPALPSAGQRYLHAMAYDSQRGHMVVFSGDNSQGLATGTWEYCPWRIIPVTCRPVTCPALRAGHRMAFDSARGRVILFGGSSPGGLFTDTWAYHAFATPTVCSQPVSRTICPNVAVMLSFSVCGAEPLMYQWRHNGTPIPAPDGTAVVLTISNPLPADAGAYDCVVSNTCGNVTSNAATLTVWDSCLPGDMNCGGLVDNFDIDPFVLALTNPAAYRAAFPNCNINNADVNRDGVVNNFDIDPFVMCLTNGCP